MTDNPFGRLSIYRIISIRQDYFTPEATPVQNQSNIKSKRSNLYQSFHPGQGDSVTWTYDVCSQGQEKLYEIYLKWLLSITNKYVIYHLLEASFLQLLQIQLRSNRTIRSASTALCFQISHFFKHNILSTYSWIPRRVHWVAWNTEQLMMILIVSIWTW